jgi:hypothetical protein
MSDLSERRLKSRIVAFSAGRELNNIDTLVDSSFTYRRTRLLYEEFAKLSVTSSAQ